MLYIDISLSVGYTYIPENTTFSQTSTEATEIDLSSTQVRATIITNKERLT
jgi:hypothetical protein